MSTFTLDDLKRVLRSSGDTADAARLDPAALDTPVAELGYDSLAMLEVASIVQREYGVPMPDESIEHMLTPRSTIAYINDRLAKAGAA